MDYIFASEEVWALKPDSHTLTVLKNKFENALDFKVFNQADELSSRLSDASIQKPSLLVVDTENNEAERFLSKLVPEARRLDRMCPTLLVASRAQYSLLKKFCGTGEFDYILKPLDQEEFDLRFDVLTKRVARHVSFTLALLRSFGSELTSTELKILFCFLSKQGKPISRAEIMELIWGGSVVHPKTLDVHLFNLRKKLASIGYQITSGRGGIWTLKRNTAVSVTETQKSEPNKGEPEEK